MNVRRPSWLVSLMEEHRHVFETVVRRATRVSDWAIDDVEALGCGVYGCAFRVGGGPWVFKVTVDPHEGPMWRYLKRLRENLKGEGSRAADAIPAILAVADVTRKLPRVKLDGAACSVHVVVREDVEPLQVRVRSGRWIKSRGTQSRVLSGGILADGAFDAVHEAISSYDTEARVVDRLSRRNKRLPSLDREESDARGRMRAAAKALAGTRAGSSLGSLLQALADDGVYLRDLSTANVGFPATKVSGRRDGLVLLDPGHTDVLSRHTRVAANPPRDEDETLQGVVDYDGGLEVDVLTDPTGWIRTTTFRDR